MLDIATAHGDLGALRRAIRIEPEIGCVTVHCVSSDAMWTVVVALARPRCDTARVLVAASHDAARGPRFGGEATIGEVRAVIDAIERDDIASAMRLLHPGDPTRQPPAPLGRLCGIFKPVGRR